MGEYLLKFAQLFVGTFVSTAAKIITKHLFSKKGKEKPTLASDQRKQSGNSKP